MSDESFAIAALHCALTAHAWVHRRRGTLRASTTTVAPRNACPATGPTLAGTQRLGILVSLLLFAGIWLMLAPARLRDNGTKAQSSTVDPETFGSKAVARAAVWCVLGRVGISPP